eukprot:364015-Pelagomonas_calceolata.AAC.2
MPVQARVTRHTRRNDIAMHASPQISSWLVAARAQDTVVVYPGNGENHTSVLIVATAVSQRHAAACVEAVRWQVGACVRAYVETVCWQMRACVRACMCGGCVLADACACACVHAWWLYAGRCMRACLLACEEGVCWWVLACERACVRGEAVRWQVNACMRAGCA